MGIMTPPASPPEFRETDDRLRLFENTIDLDALRLDPSRLGQLATRSKEQIFKELLSVVNVLLVLADDAKVAMGRSEELENELDAMQNVLVTTKNDYATLESELDATQSVLVTTKSDFATLQTEYTTSKSAYAAIRSELSTTRGDLLTTRGELATTKREVDLTKRELDAMKSQLDVTSSELDVTRSELDATRSELDATRGGLVAMRTELASTQQELQASNSKAMPSSKQDMSWTQDLIKQTIEREIAAAKEQLKSPTAKNSIDTTRPTLPPKSKSEYKPENRFENADTDRLGSTMGHIITSTNGSSNNSPESVGSNVPWSEAMINAAFASKEPNVASKEPNVLTKKRSASTSRGRSTTIKSLLASTPGIPTRRSRSSTVTTSVPVINIPPVEDMPSRDIRDMGNSWDLVAYNQRANENRASKRMTYMPSVDSFASNRTTSTASISRNSSDMPWSDRPMSRDTTSTISPMIESRHWDDRPMSSRGPTNMNNRVTLYDVPRNQETPRETAIRLATSANKAIVSQMRWQTDCTQGNAKWTYSTTLPDSAMFYSIFGNDKGKKWKQKKVSLQDFRNALGDVETTRFDNRFKVTGDGVKVKWDDKSLTWSMSGTYGI